VGDCAADFLGGFHANPESIQARRPTGPTRIGANPQLSIYGITNRLAQGLAKRLSEQDVILA
jgi:hypothetical protein